VALQVRVWMWGQEPYPIKIYWSETPAIGDVMVRKQIEKPRNKNTNFSPHYKPVYL